MRARSVFAILGAALIGLAVAPAQARHGGGDVAASHFGSASLRPFVAGRSVGSLPSHRNQIFVLNRSSGRVVAPDRRVFARSRRSTPFGFGGGFGGFGSGFGDFGGFGGFIESPAVLGIGQPIQEVAQPPRSRLAADLPPCHETTPAGVVIERGMACSHIPR
jgi:hypothetical protein